MKLYTCGAFRVLTSLCISDICLANCVSAVSGRSEYKFLLISFLPSSLYFTCTHTHTDFKQLTHSRDTFTFRLCLCFSPHCRCLSALWPAVSLWLQVADDTESCSPPSYRPVYTSPTKTPNNRQNSNCRGTFACVFSLVCDVSTWLCSCATSLACWVSRVSGSFEYRELDASFFPASLYLLCKTKRGK